MITVQTILAQLPCRILTGSNLAGTRQISGGYAGDMLSWVMAHAGRGDVWLTILCSLNVVAVASLTECACVLLTESVLMEDAVLARAEAQGVIILSTPLTTFAAATALQRILTDLPQP
jgi:BioD-like phosphotransacetylase family protein